MIRLRPVLVAALLCVIALAGACVLPSAASAKVAQITTVSKTDPDIITTRNIVFATRPGVGLKMDVRRSTRTAPGAPVVLLLHGGGWWFGTRADLMDTAPVATSFAKAGFIAISIDYRLSCGTAAVPRKRYGVDYTRPSTMCGAYIMDQVADVHDAVRFTRANAASWGANPDRISLLGASAGGHLALLAAATASADAQVRAVANWSGPSSTRFIAKQNPYRKPSIIGSFTNAVGCLWIGSKSCKQRWDDVSPYARVSGHSPKFAVLAVSGQFEHQVPASTHRQFDTKLRRFGYPSKVVALPSFCHGAGCRRLYVGTPSGKMRTVEATTITYLAAHS